MEPTSDVPLVGEGYDGDLSMQMSMAIKALTSPGKVLLLMVLGCMGTSGVGLCARGSEIVWGEQDGHQKCNHDYSSYWIQ